MTVLWRLRSWWGAVRRRARFEAEMDEEFRAHLAERAADLERRGLTPAAAARRARVEFGSVERYKEESRHSRGLRFVDELRTDVRYGVRSLGRSPVFTAVAVLTLALGVGANAAVFSLLNATLLRPLPFAEPDRLVTLYQTVRGPGDEARVRRWSYAEYEALRSVLRSVEHVAAYYSVDMNVSGAGEPVRVRAETVSVSYFHALRVTPQLGRTFAAEEDSIPGVHAVALLGDMLWRTHFDGDAGVLGSRIHVNGVPVTVVGVLPVGFAGLSGDASVWIPHAMAPALTYAGHLTTPQQFLSVVARLAPGVDLDGAGAELAASGAAAAAAARRDAGEAGGSWSAHVTRMDDARRDARTTRAYAILAVAVFFVLLIAAANLAALLFARHVGRVREVAVRTALGAGRLRLVRMITTEGALLGVLGGALGVLFAVWSVRVLAVLVPTTVGRGGPAGVSDLASFATPVLDGRVVAYTVAVALLAGVLAALAPALRLTRGELALALRIGARGSSAGMGTLRRPTLLSVTALAQVACAFVLLMAAGLLLDAFQRLRSVDPGFDAAGIITLRLTAPEHAYAGEAAAALLERVLEQVHAVPGVRAASVSFCTPYQRCSSTPLYFAGEGPSSDPPIVGRHYVGPDHFRTLGIPLLAGRALTAEDRPGRPRVAVISESAARRFWPGDDAIGRRVRFGSGGGFASPDSLTEIVGIVGDVVYGIEDHAGLDFYTSYLQFTWPAAFVIVRTAAAPADIVPSLRRAVAAVDPDLPIYDVRTMEQRAADAIAAERFATRAVASFALLGVLLAALGVYGVMAHAVAQRRREIGIRVALGATRPAVLGLVIRQALAVAAVGLIIGGGVAVLLVGSLASLVPDAGTLQPHVVTATSLLLLLVATLAAALPARAAARVDPVETLASD